MGIFIIINNSFMGIRVREDVFIVLFNIFTFWFTSILANTLSQGKLFIWSLNMISICFFLISNYTDRKRADMKNFEVHPIFPECKFCLVKKTLDLQIKALKNYCEFHWKLLNTLKTPTYLWYFDNAYMSDDVSIDFVSNTLWCI